jgi:uncharacterized BrkB/YihY/UPF0761 family membrane protein
VLWELTRRVLVWYFARLSMANLIYGSMAAVVVVLLTLEAAAVILLLGAQVIAEIDRVRVWCDPPRDPGTSAAHSPRQGDASQSVTRGSRRRVRGSGAAEDPRPSPAGRHEAGQ